MYHYPVQLYFYNLLIITIVIMIVQISYLKLLMADLLNHIKKLQFFLVFI